MTHDPWQPTDFDTTRPAVVEDLVASPLLDSLVMMVDDDPLMIELVQGHLEDAGYRRFVANSEPLRTLELLRERQPALLLLDLMMPEISGFDLLQRIRADDALRFLPVIVLTAASGADAKLRALQLGATDFLAKPVDASELVLRVRNTLAFQQYHERNLNYDRGSGLPTRRLFVKQVARALAGSDPTQTWWAVLEAHVPECRQVAETLGQEAADLMARTLGTRLQEVVRTLRDLGRDEGPNSALVARLGTADFALLVGGARQLEQLHEVAQQALAEMSRPVQIDTQQVSCTPVLGIALSGTDGRTAEALVAGAEQARSQASKRGGAGYEFYSPELNRRALERMSQATHLRRAIENTEFVLHYQPKVDLHSTQLAGVEALVRWQLPNGTVLPPLRFIPLAEELGLVGTIGEWVMERACRDAAEWLMQGVPVGQVSVNVSQAQFTRGVLARTVADTLARTGLPARHLLLEITESMLMADVHTAMDTLAELREIGVELAIDDFGTGYSSLAYLKQFPVSELKIDRSFIAGLPGGPRDMAILRAIVALGHHLDMRVIAEGVETAAQMLALAELDCDGYQGFLYSRPLPANQVLPVLRAGT